jgi:predicted glycoside hydrolase/deacetylase ChbG (UPF0249 family)
MKKLVVVADDFGLCNSVNDGIMLSQQQGIVMEPSLMLGSPGTDDAIKRIKSGQVNTVGLHLLLIRWQEHGDIFRRGEYGQLFADASEADLQRLFDAELALFEELVGRPPTHLTSQYGIISHPKLLPIAVAYANKYNLPMRLPAQAMTQDEPVTALRDVHVLQQNHITTTDYFIGQVLGSEQSVRDALLTQLGAVEEGESAELMLHPGKVSQKLRGLTSLVAERERDLRLATDPKFRSEIEALGFTLATYDDLKTTNP